jgi:hypothetical protein
MYIISTNAASSLLLYSILARNLIPALQTIDGIVDQDQVCIIVMGRDRSKHKFQT